MLSFALDRMEPGFFLKLAENTGDGFANVVLPVKEVKDIPTTRNPTTLVRCVVRSRSVESAGLSNVRNDPAEFKFINSKGTELLRDETNMTIDEINRLATAYSAEMPITGCSKDSGTDIVNHRLMDINSDKINAYSPTSNYIKNSENATNVGVKDTPHAPIKLHSDIE